MLPAWLNFISMLLLTGLLIRYIETNYPESTVGKALLYIY